MFASWLVLEANIPALCHYVSDFEKKKERRGKARKGFFFRTGGKSLALNM